MVSPMAALDEPAREEVVRVGLSRPEGDRSFEVRFGRRRVAEGIAPYETGGVFRTAQVNSLLEHSRPLEVQGEARLHDPGPTGRLSEGPRALKGLGTRSAVPMGAP